MRFGSFVLLATAIAALLLAACTVNADDPVSDPSHAATETPSPSPSPSPTPRLAGEPYPPGAVGFAISWPQCGAVYPEEPFAFGIIGISDGRAMTRNPCFEDEYRWAERGRYPPSIYLNTNYRASQNVSGLVNCGDEPCRAYHYGSAAAQDAYQYAVESNAVASVWWLDVQIVSEWSTDTHLNEQSVLGAAEFLKSKGIRVGISSTSYQWAMVAGPSQHHLSIWDASAANVDQAEEFCRQGKDFGGGRTELIAWIDRYETVISCGLPDPQARGSSWRTQTATPAPT